MPRGGARSRARMGGYANRTDMLTQPVQAPPSTEYGSAARLTEAQRVVPLARAPAVEAGSLYGDTARPNEPVHAGLPVGPGPGPMAAVSDIDLVRAAARRFPNSGIERLLEALEDA